MSGGKQISLSQLKGWILVFALALSTGELCALASELDRAIEQHGRAYADYYRALRKKRGRLTPAERKKIKNQHLSKARGELKESIDRAVEDGIRRYRLAEKQATQQPGQNQNNGQEPGRQQVRRQTTSPGSNSRRSRQKVRSVELGGDFQQELVFEGKKEQQRKPARAEKPQESEGAYYQEGIDGSVIPGTLVFPGSQKKPQKSSR